jgi:hypothetical protein
MITDDHIKKMSAVKKHLLNRVFKLRFTDSDVTPYITIKDMCIISNHKNVRYGKQRYDFIILYEITPDKYINSAGDLITPNHHLVAHTFLEIFKNYFNYNNLQITTLKSYSEFLNQLNSIDVECAVFY